MTIRIRLLLMYASLTFRKAWWLRKSKVIPAVADQIPSPGPPIACFQLGAQKDYNDFYRWKLFRSQVAAAKGFCAPAAGPRPTTRPERGSLARCGAARHRRSPGHD